MCEGVCHSKNEKPSKANHRITFLTWSKTTYQNLILIFFLYSTMAHILALFHRLRRSVSLPLIMSPEMPASPARKHQATQTPADQSTALETVVAVVMVSAIMAGAVALVATFLRQWIAKAKPKCRSTQMSRRHQLITPDQPASKESTKSILASQKPASSLLLPPRYRALDQSSEPATSIEKCCTSAFRIADTTTWSETSSVFLCDFSTVLFYCRVFVGAILKGCVIYMGSSLKSRAFMYFCKIFFVTGLEFSCT